MNFPKTKNPDATRATILQVAAHEMRLRGFQAASLSQIIGKCGLSKGAVYHHFRTKQELGYAVFEEIYQQDYFDFWDSALDQDDAVSGILGVLATMPDKFSEQDMAYGCPVNSISQEMSSEDEGFRLRTLAMYKSLQRKIAAALSLAIEKGQVKADVEVESTALFIVTSFQGMASMMKASRDKSMVADITKAISDYVEMLRYC